MPPGPSDLWPESYHNVIEYHYAQYDKAIAFGEYQPLVYPWACVDLLLVTIYLLIPHQNRPWLKKCRFLVFACVLMCAVYKIRYTRMRGLAPALVNGLINSWMTIWVFAILVCNDAQTDFMRIERTTGVFRPSKHSQVNGSSEVKETDVHKTARDDIPFPLSPMLERLDWVHDIVYNFRGMGWNWRISAVAPAPKGDSDAASPQLGRHCAQASFKTHAGQVKQYATRGELLRSNLGTLATGYLALDVIKTAMMNDRYFWGYIYHDPPSYLPSLITSSPHMTHAYRMTWAPYSVVLDNGIAGWWGNWWHQTFRFAFQEPSRKLYEVLQLDRKSKAAKMLHLLQGPMAFFLLQAGAIFAEIWLTQLARAAGIGTGVTWWLKKTWTFVYQDGWWCWSGQLIRWHAGETWWKSGLTM
ncbi:hypothetical protein J3E73DRAFT_435302 [Bipolaris maydis]|nr:hypothetical protein J3E73DRAFT_435302 [Bipolaris maydis]